MKLPLLCVCVIGVYRKQSILKEPTPAQVAAAQVRYPFQGCFQIARDQPLASGVRCTGKLYINGPRAASETDATLERAKSVI